MKFKEYKLQDICKVVDSLHKTPSYENKGVPMIRVTDLKDGYFSIPNEVKLVSQEVFSEFSKKHIPEFNDILMSRVGSYGITSIIKTREKFCLGQNTIVITDFSEEVLSEYLFYYLISSYGKELIEKNVSGSTQKTISLKSINNFNILLPEKSYQNEVINILSSFYKKIEVNNKIIANLEEQAQAIFKSWFVDFEPFQDGNFVESELGMIPEGWEVNELKNITNCKLGGTPNRKIKNYWNGNIGWINSGEVNKDRIIEPTEYITLEGLKNSATKLLDKKTTVIAITGATLGQVSLLEIECCTNQSIIGIEQNKDLPYEYLYLFIKNNIARIISNQTGAAQQHINLNDIKTTKIILPTENIMTKYKSITSAFFEKIEKSYFENKKLAEIRDALLPKLMSGEIDVSNIKIKGEEVKNE